MRSYHRLVLGSIFLFSAVPALAQSTITYRVEPQMADKVLRVRLDIPRVRELTVRVQMPVWTPGSYSLGNFANNVTSISATDMKQKPLRVTHPDPNTWEIAANGASAIQVQYTVKGVDLEQGTDGPRRGHISGPRTYLYVVGRKEDPLSLELITPPGAKRWEIATGLDPVAKTAQVSRFKAPNYDVLADAPVEMGDFVEERFEVRGKTHHVVLYGQYERTDRAKLVDYCKRVAQTQTAFFGDAPFNRYVFQFRTTSAPISGVGGLEHLSSTEIGTVGQVNDRVRSVIAHEYFHLWNVKRIRPLVLGPFNYVNPPRTANLWWSEGVTSYYGDLLSLRGGLNTREEYLRHLSETITQLQNNSARLRVSADEASLRVWDAAGSQGFGGLSYYTKGELVGLCLDLKIRQVTAGRVSLDDVIRALYAQGRRGAGPGFEEDDIKKTVNRISGRDLSDFYDQVVRSVDELPFDECLASAGMSLTRVEPPLVRGETGMSTRFDRETRALIVTAVTVGGAADKAELKAGTRIVAVNGSTDSREMMGGLSGARPNTVVKLTITQGDAPREVELAIQPRNLYQYRVVENPAATPEQVRLRGAWLGGK